MQKIECVFNSEKKKLNFAFQLEQKMEAAPY